MGPDATIGRLRIHYPAVTSTMDVAASLAAAGAPHGTVVTTDHQTAGRGRHGRTWSDAPGCSLLASWVLRLPTAPASLGVLSPLVALAVARSIATIAPAAPVRVKWPNDVLIDGRKVAGILLTSRGTSRGEGGVTRVIAGTGINVRHVGPPETTSLDSWSSGVTVRDVLDTLADALDRLWPEIASLGMTEAAHAELERLLAWRGERVTVIVPDARIEGVVTGLGRDGALLLRADGANDPMPVHVGAVLRGPRVTARTAAGREEIGEPRLRPAPADTDSG